MRKILWLDWGYFQFRAIYAWKKTRTTAAPYMCLASIISNIKKVGLNPEDTVIIAVDSPHGNWRKEIDPEYKANRRAKREQEDIDWDDIFAQFQRLLETLEAYTPFHTILVEKMEADDIIAYGCKKFQDTECIILSADCLQGNTPIKMAEGNSTIISRIKENDKVLSYDFENKRFAISTVIKKHKVFHKERYKIYYENAKIPIKCSSNHHFLTKKGWKKAKELKNNDILLHYKEKNLPINNLQNNYKVGYILGFAEGDGYFDHKRRYIGWEQKDIEPLIRIKKYVFDLFKIKCKIKRNKRNYYTLGIYFNIGFEYILKYKKKKSKEFEKGFLAGFYDAECSLREVKTGLSIRFVNTNLELLNLCKKYLLNNNIESSNLFGKKRKQYKICKAFVLNSENSVKFLNLCKPALLRKYPSWKHHIGHLCNGLKIKKIEKEFYKTQKFKHYDITCEPYHNYIINNKIIVHNSDYEQLCAYPKVKIFSTLSKKYKHIDNPYKIILQKIRKETADNLISPILTKEDYIKREKIVNLVKLPKEIEEQIEPFLNNLYEKEWDYEGIYYPDLRERLKTIYSQDNIVSFFPKLKRRKKESKKQLKL